MDKKKIIILSMAVLLLGAAIAGGTYAWLTYNITVNGNASALGSSSCFIIDYGITNQTGTTSTNNSTITGVLFQSADPKGGLSGSVNMKMNSACTNITGKGSIYLNLPSGISSVLTQTAFHCENTSTHEWIKLDDAQNNSTGCTAKGGTWTSAHCEEAATLVSLPNQLTSSTCTASGGTWISGSSALKYAVATDANFTSSSIVSKGYITPSMVPASGNLATKIWDGKNAGGVVVPISTSVQYYYISIWLDGYMANNSYSTKNFSGYITASADQIQ